MPTAARPQRTRTLIGWGTMGQIVYVGSQFILLLALTRYADIETVGYFGLASAIIIPIYWLLRLELRVNLASETQDRFRFSEFLALLLGTMTVGYCALLIIALYWLPEPAQGLLLLFGLAKLAETFSELCYGIFQKHHQMSRVARSQMIRGGLSAVAFFLVMAAGASPSFAFAILAAIWGLVLLLHDLPVAIRMAQTTGGWHRPRPDRIAVLFREAIPLGLNGLLSALQGNVPRYVVERLIGIAALGQLTVVMYAMQALTTVAMAISHSLTASFAAQAAAGNRAGFFRTLRKLLILIWGLALVATLLSALTGDWILEHVFGTEFANLGLVLTLCCIGAGLRASVLILQGALLAARQFRRNLYIRMAMLCTMVLFCVAGGQISGLTGVVIGMSASFMLHLGILGLALTHLRFTTKTEHA